MTKTPSEQAAEDFALSSAFQMTTSWGIHGIKEQSFLAGVAWRDKMLLEWLYKHLQHHYYAGQGNEDHCESMSDCIDEEELRKFLKGSE